MNYKICRIETLEELIEEHRNISQKVSVYEFDETSYTLFLIEINKVLKENQQLKEQQKEFIDYLEKEIVDSRAGSSQYYSAMQHLKLFKEIIGSDKQ